MAERGMSLRGLARAATYDPSHLSKVLNGRKPCTPQLAARLDDVLGAGGKIRDAAATFDGSLSPDRRDRLDWTARKPRATDMAAVEALADVLAAQRRAEDSLGSEAMLRPVRAQIAVVEDLVTEAPASGHSTSDGSTSTPAARPKARHGYGRRCSGRPRPGTSTSSRRSSASRDTPRG